MKGESAGLRWANELSELPYSPLKICQCVFDLGSGCVVWCVAVCAEVLGRASCGRLGDRRARVGRR